MRYFVICSIFLFVIAVNISFSAGGGISNGFFLQSVHADTTPQSLPFSQDWSNTGLITTNDDWSGVPGIIGYRGDTSVQATGFDPQAIVAPRTDTIDVNANQINPNTFTSGGVAEFDVIANPTVALQGSGTADAPFLLINLNTTGQTNINVSYNVRDVDGSTDNSVQQVALQYRIGTSGDFTNIPAGYIADATTGPSLATLVTPVNVTLPALAENQPHIQIRIMTTNAVGNDEWVGIDDISVTAGPVLTPSFSIDKSDLNFGSLLVGTTHTDTVNVTNTGGASLDISSVGSDNPRFTVSPTSASIAAAASAQFFISFAPTSAGIQTGTVTFTHNAISSPDVVTVGGQGVDSGFSVTPISLSFGNLLVGSTHTDTLIVSNGGPGTLTISSAGSTNGQFSVNPASGAIPALGSELFFVTFAPTSQGLKLGNIIFTHDGTGSPDSVSISGTGVGGTFSAAPTTISFGELFVGSTAVDTITVTNGGGGDLTISSITSSNGEISVSPSNAVVPAASSAKFAVTLAPTTTGPKSANIIFLHDGPSAHDTVKASGRGLQLMSIAAARALPNGSEVTIEGIMTRSLGVFMRIQDSTGGLSIRQTTGAFFDSITSGGLRPGDSVRITGKTSEFSALKQINGTDFISFKRLERDHAVPAAQIVTLAELAANGEQYESELVTVVGVSIIAGGDVNFSAARTYQMTDASDSTQRVSLRIPNAGDSEVDGLTIPTGPVILTCVLGQFSSADPAAGYQILAVLAGDVQIQVGVPETQTLPDKYALKGNYPNPFNPSTTIAFDVPKQSLVNLVVYNLLGQQVATILDNADYAAGRYTILFDGSQLASGVYLYRMTAGEFSAVKRMLILK